jgi:hypothetical protein
LIDDKKGMSEKCEKLVKELKTIDKKYQDKVKTMDDRYVQNLIILFFNFLHCSLCKTLDPKGSYSTGH